ncbi:DUF6428 family protein [Mucilaginibacter sp. KACC 22063]|uniref:DUF6428 family protein n=1 Tax=Mucilaginibacter sp. KACC 22063 TaxID=3025666 RepID=UPI0023669CF6|nr:DUF6428 family protein [Mucilaginibacter sp. KACC 22063]WDF54299.1 DUF6428 family protein [Mucilaginibacter sp. KACC 22063]
MNMETMNWQTFKQTIEQNQTLDLQFQYAENKWVSPSYHITEIKQAPITSVDCGGVVNKWTEVVVQLWEPEVKQQERAMKARKALSIIELVEKSLVLDADAIVKIEFGNSNFDTRQMLPQKIYADGDNLIVDLRPDTVQCKANDRGESCGPKPKIQLKNLAAGGNSCTPGSGCC